MHWTPAPVRADLKTRTHRLLGAALTALAAVAAVLLILVLAPAAHAALRGHGPLTLNGAHNRVYEGYYFKGSGDGRADSSGVIRIGGSTHNITFRNCVIGTNQDGVGNGVKICDEGRGIHDITFVNCTFKYQPRMGFECIGRGPSSRTGYRRVNLINCTFRASAGEAISYDDNSGTAGRCRVASNLVKGAGVGDRYQYGHVFEINGTHNMTVVNNRFWAGRDGILNLQMHDTKACGWVFSRNVVNAREIVSGITVKDTAQPVVAFGVYGGRFDHNRIINHDSWNIAYLADCHNMDWRTTRWIGPNRAPYRTDCSSILL